MSRWGKPYQSQSAAASIVEAYKPYNREVSLVKMRVSA